MHVTLSGSRNKSHKDLIFSGIFVEAPSQKQLDAVAYKLGIRYSDELLMKRL
jgi:hypothetical protein